MWVLLCGLVMSLFIPNHLYDVGRADSQWLIHLLAYLSMDSERLGVSSQSLQITTLVFDRFDVAPGGKGAGAWMKPVECCQIVSRCAYILHSQQ